MNRRTFLQAAASTVAALQCKAQIGRFQTSEPAEPTPVEVDLADPSSRRWRENPAVDAYVRLEELYPGDPGQLSGTSLRITESGKSAWLRAEFGTHCLGFLDAGKVADFVSTVQADSRQELRTFLFELYPEIEPRRWSGSSLLFMGGDDPEIRLCCGFGAAHCLGVVRGANLGALLECARVRCEGVASEAAWA